MNNLYKYFCALTLLSLLSACNNNTSESFSEIDEGDTSLVTLEQTQFNSSNFALGKMEQKIFSKYVNAIGTIEIPEKSTAAVSTLMSGTIGAINLIEGEWVKKGQTLFTITNPELINMQEEYLIAAGQLEYLQEEYNRQIDLENENLSTKKELLKAKSELNTTQARHGALTEKLKLYGINTENLTTNALVSLLSVRAPISGYITHIEAIQGMYLEPNKVALRIANTSHVHLELSVLEKDALLLKKEQSLTFTLQGSPSKSYKASIHLINRSINENHMISLHCHIEDDSSKDLVPGMYANAKILLEGYSANGLPEAALVKMEEDYYALILRSQNDTAMEFEKMKIEEGAIQNDYIEIKNNLDPETEFLTKGAYFLIQ